MRHPFPHLGDDFLEYVQEQLEEPVLFVNRGTSGRLFLGAYCPASQQLTYDTWGSDGILPVPAHNFATLPECLASPLTDEEFDSLGLKPAPSKGHPVGSKRYVEVEVRDEVDEDGEQGIWIPSSGPFGGRWGYVAPGDLLEATPSDEPGATTTPKRVKRYVEVEVLEEQSLEGFVEINVLLGEAGDVPLYADPTALLTAPLARVNGEEAIPVSTIRKVIEVISASGTGSIPGELFVSILRGFQES